MGMAQVLTRSYGQNGLKIHKIRNTIREFLTLGNIIRTSNCVSEKPLVSISVFDFRETVAEKGLLEWFGHFLASFETRLAHPICRLISFEAIIDEEYTGLVRDARCCIIREIIYPWAKESLDAYKSPEIRRQENR